MIQTIIKVLTLGFFVSTLTGFVIYRMGYFDAASASSSLQTSPNGGELNNANQSNQAPDSTKIPEINQQNQPAIMPSSKSGRAFDLEKYEEKKAKELRMSSSKSMAHPIEIKTIQGLIEPKVELENPYIASPKPEPTLDFEKYQQQKEEQVRMSSSKSLIMPINLKLSKELIERFKLDDKKVQPEITTLDTTQKKELNVDDIADPTFVSNQIESVKETKTEKPSGTHWGMIGLGVLGILFVGIGSIVYFKRKSK